MALRNPAQHKFLEHIRSQMLYTTFAAFGLLNTNDLLRAVDMLDFEPDDFVGPEATVSA
jgi:hypothetical protein